jgi:hypothetical protein
MAPVDVPFRFETEQMLWWVDDVYTPDECRRFIERIEAAGPELATNNPELEATVVPKQGRVAIFQHKLSHEGCALITGTKYAMRTDVVYGAR